jgi:catechol 2,3-dioxygenase-like lactoylglutathione lyase family enzyme
MGMQIDHVQLAAPPGCEREARNFYGELLGMREIEKPEALRRHGGVWFEHLHIGVEDSFSPARKAHPALRVDQLELLAERLVENAVEVVWDDALPGVNRFYTEDPWGNRLEFLA